MTARDLTSTQGHGACFAAAPVDFGVARSSFRRQAEKVDRDPDPRRPVSLFGWTYSDGAFPGYTFVDPGVEAHPIEQREARCAGLSLAR
jgi:hypothetical protein